MEFGPIRFGSGATWLQHWGNGSSNQKYTDSFEWLNSYIAI